MNLSSVFKFKCELNYLLKINHDKVIECLVSSLLTVTNESKVKFVNEHNGRVDLDDKESSNFNSTIGWYAKFKAYVAEINDGNLVIKKYTCKDYSNVKVCININEAENDGQVWHDFINIDFPTLIDYSAPPFDITFNVVFTKTEIEVVIIYSKGDLFSGELLNYYVTVFNENLDIIGTNNYFVLNKNKDKNKNNLLFLPPLGGRAYWYNNLLSSLSETYNIGYFQFDESLIDSNIGMDKLVEYVCETISGINNKVILVGWSFGCVLCNNIVIEMMGEGKEIYQILLDYPSDNRNDGKSFYDGMNNVRIGNRIYKSHHVNSMDTYSKELSLELKLVQYFERMYQPTNKYKIAKNARKLVVFSNEVSFSHWLANSYDVDTLDEILILGDHMHYDLMESKSLVENIRRYVECL